MRRLRENSVLNGPDAYSEMFVERQKGEVDWFDSLRWERLIKDFNGGKIIDLGCLDSLIPMMAKKRFPECESWGLDQAEDAIHYLARECPEINYTVGDVYKTELPTGYFDYVVAGELIEHLEKPEDFFAEAFRILKPGGILAISTPKEETEKGEVDGFRHLWSYTREDIKEMCQLYSSKVKIGTLRSKYFPYKYHWPYIICWATKKK